MNNSELSEFRITITEASKTVLKPLGKNIRGAIHHWMGHHIFRPLEYRPAPTKKPSLLSFSDLVVIGALHSIFRLGVRFSDLAGETVHDVDTPETEQFGSDIDTGDMELNEFLRKIYTAVRSGRSTVLFEHFFMKKDKLSIFLPKGKKIEGLKLGSDRLMQRYFEACSYMCDLVVRDKSCLLPRVDIAPYDVDRWITLYNIYIYRSALLETAPALKDYVGHLEASQGFWSFSHISISCIAKYVIKRIKLRGQDK